MGLFSGIGGVKPREDYAPFLEPGSYRLKIKTCGVKTSEKKKGQHFFKVLFEVVEAPASWVNGDEAAWLVDLGHGETALRDVAGLATALLGPGVAIEESVMEELIGAEQPTTGMECLCRVTVVKTQAGNDFSRHTFTPVEGAAK